MRDKEIDEIVSLAQPQETKQVDPEIAEIVSLAEPQKKPEELQESPEQESEMSWGEALTEGLSNIPSSGWDYAKDIASAVIHPVETLKSLNTLAGSFGQKLVPGKQSDEKYADAVMDFYKDRYGSVEGFKKSFAENPIGVLSDFASVVMVGGGTLSKTAKLSGLTKTAKTGSTITQIGAQLEPMNLAWNIAKTPIRLIPDKVPLQMYENAVKFSSKFSPKQKNKFAKTALENDIAPTLKGLEKVQDNINVLNEKVNALVNRAKYEGKTIRVEELFKDLDGLAATMRMNTDEPIVIDKAMASIRKQMDKMLELGDTRNPAQIQKIKQNIYKDLASLFDQHNKSPAKGTLRKHIGKNAKESLEVIAPEVKNYNFKEGELIELYEALQGRANTITNQDIFSFGLAMRMGTGAGVGSMVAGQAGAKIGTGAGVVAAIWHHPKVKSKLARVIHSIQAQGGTVSNLPTLIRLGLYETAEKEELLREGGGS